MNGILEKVATLVATKLEKYLVTKPEIHRIPRFIDVDQVLVRKGPYWYIGQRKLPREEVAALKEDAKQLKGSYLWRFMRRDVHYIAYLQATAKCRTEDDALYAGAMYKNLEVLEQFIENLTTL
jgi:hypothetical protein